MTRENEPPSTPDNNDLPDNVIAFPKPRTEKPAEPEPEAETSADDAVADSAPEEPTMTLDAFERAVRAAVHDKLGDDTTSQPRGADELVAQVFSALTGKDAKSALAEVRSRLSEPSAFIDPRNNDADVIDLGAVREARQKQSLDAAGKVGNALKDTVTGFLSNIAQRQGQTELTLDAGFFKQHGPTLLGNLFQSLASAFMQQARTNLTPDTAERAATPATAPTDTTGDTTPPGEPTAETQTNAPAAEAPPAPPVQVRLDLASLLSGLFRKVTRPEPPSEEPPKT